MIEKKSEKILAISLRKEGKTYNEILTVVTVAKSTLSLWLRSVGLAEPQQQRITALKKAAQWNAAHAKRAIRVKRQSLIISNAEKEIVAVSDRELWLIGIALYWAEGSKEKSYSPGTQLSFSNSDPRMIRLFILWLERCASVSRSDITCSIYIHESHRTNTERAVEYWSMHTQFPKENFTQIYFKKNKINTKRRNIGDLYYGLLRVTIAKSSTLNRKIAGWTNGIVTHCGIV